MSEPVTGKGVDRVEARLKVTGKATFAAEVPVANVAHAVIVGSRIAKGRIASIEGHEAERAPGVLAVLTHLNAPRLPGVTKKTSPIDHVLQILQDDRVLYADQPVALVVADSLERAQYAASLVVTRYDESAPVTDLERDPRQCLQAQSGRSSQGARLDARERRRRPRQREGEGRRDLHDARGEP